MFPDDHDDIGLSPFVAKGSGIIGKIVQTRHLHNASYLDFCRPGALCIGTTGTRYGLEYTKCGSGRR